MKRTNRALFAKRILCFLLMLVLTAGCLPLTAHAATLSKQKILDALDFSDERIYDENYFTCSADDLATLIADALENVDGPRDVVYDDELSTDETRKYILMGGGDKPTLFVHCGMSSKKVWRVEIGIKHEEMNNEAFADGLYLLAVAYGAINKNMNGHDWERFATDYNLGRVEEADNTYLLTGIFYDLYYRIAVDDRYMVLTVSPEGNVNNAARAQYFPKGQAFVTEKYFSIIADDLRQDSYGNITVDITLKNTGKKALTFHLDHASVEGVCASLSIFATVAPGKERKVSLHISSAFLAGAELKYIGDLRLVLAVNEADSGESVFEGAHVLPLGMGVNDPMVLHSEGAGKKLFENEEFVLKVIGTFRESENSAPKLLVHMTNNVCGEVRLESESGVCTVGNQEYSMYTNLIVGRYGYGVAVLSPLDYSHEGKATWSFDLQISTRNYNPLVSGIVTVKLDEDGAITSVTSKMKELSGYDKTLDAEY